TTTWDALLTQAKLLSIAWGEGEFLAMALVVTQVLLLALPVPATLYVISSVLRVPAGVAWHWSKPTGTRRLVGALGAAAAAAVLVFLWAPRHSQPRKDAGSRAVLSRSDPADPLHHTRAATERLETLQADLEGMLGSDRFSGTVVLKRPNRARVRIKIKGQQDFGEYLVVSDGRGLFVYF